MRYRWGKGFPVAPCRRANPASRHTANRPLLLCVPHLTRLQTPSFRDSQRSLPHLPAPGAQATSQPQALSSAGKAPRAPPRPHVAKGTEAPPRSRWAPPLRPHPDMGNKVQRRQKNDTQADEGGHHARCGPWPYEAGTEPFSAWLPTFPSPAD